MLKAVLGHIRELVERDERSAAVKRDRDHVKADLATPGAGRHVCKPLTCEAPHAHELAAVDRDERIESRGARLDLDEHDRPRVGNDEVELADRAAMVAREQLEAEPLIVLQRKLLAPAADDLTRVC